MEFTKMQGAGNDFVFILDWDLRCYNLERKLAVALCDRHYGIGADGIVLVRQSTIAHGKMVIVNSDGSIPKMCGNALRCFGKYLYEKGIVSSKKIRVETGDGIKELELKVENNIVREIKVCMGDYTYSPSEIGLKSDKELFNDKIVINKQEFMVSSVLIGVPHTVIIDNNYIHKINECSVIEKYELFKEGTNVDLVRVKDRKNIKVETWERGVGVTLACGTGACGAVIIANRLELVDNEVNVELKGGLLRILLDNNRVYMTGKAEFICEGIAYQ